MIELHEIDILIQKHVFNGYNPRQVTPEECTEIAGDYTDDVLYFNNKGRWVPFLPKYSDHIYFAWLVVEKLEKSFRTYTRIDNNSVVGYIVEMPKYDSENDLDDVYKATAETVPMAICLAALKSIGIEVKE